VTTNRHGSAIIEFPNDLEIVVTREFDAPIELVFDVSTKPEHARNTIAPYGEEVKVCSIDLRVGGDYRFVFVTDDGIECAFRGTCLEGESSRAAADHRTGSRLGHRQAPVPSGHPQVEPAVHLQP
jgi:uncharacterized protein YndB with AHSA1/START domain